MAVNRDILERMRASRLLTILLLLQARGRMTAQQLAEELEVSVRTVYRDMESLGEAGVPLFGDAGHDGGYRLLNGYQTRLTGLSQNEAEALFLAGLPGPAADLGLGAVLATAQLKLMAALPEGLRDQARIVQQCFHLDTSAWYAEADPTPHLAIVVGAVWNQVRIQITYRRWATPREVNRCLDPYGLVLKAGRWYLVAAGSKGIHTYRVSQILRAEVLGSRFTRPEKFNLADYWSSSLEDFDQRRFQGRATVRLLPGMLMQLPELLEPGVARAAQQSAQAPDSDGWIQVEIPIESVENAVPWLLRLGAGAEVIAPTPLRERIMETAVALTEVYRSGRAANRAE
jgi:predicted DNA-binding transcriptional regulator YafY